MLQTVDEMRADQLADAAIAEACRPIGTMAAVIEMLDAEIAAGAAASSRKRAKTALTQLLAVKGKAPETAELSVTWFDAEFPYDGWNPVKMPNLTQVTYRDYRKRSRAAIARTTGVTQARQKLRAQIDSWTDAGSYVGALPSFKTKPASVICLTSTLTLRAREKVLQTQDITNDALRRLHDEAPNGDKKSLRNAARLIHNLQTDETSSEAIRAFFPYDVEPIRTGPRRTLGIPEHFGIEVNKMVEIAARIHFVKIKGIWEYYEKGTQDNHRAILRRIVASLIATGGLSTIANSVRPALESEDALKAALKHVHDRAIAGDLAWSTARITATHLPAILERNGIYLPNLRGMIAQVKEFKGTRRSGTMPEDVKEFCCALIERPDMLADFGTAHLPLRTEADRILSMACREKRRLTQLERARVRQCGTVALFCAIETGGAPIRIENFLEMPIGGASPWLLRPSDSSFRIAIPAGRTKNKKPIDVTIRPDEIGCFETIRWYVQKIRPLFFETAATTTEEAVAAAARCRFLVPAVHSDDKSLNYRSFADWFDKGMRDIVGIVCTPHNFRHGQASILYFAFPERIDVIAQRLGDEIGTVTTYYAWVHKEIKMREGQEMLVSLIRHSHQEAVRR